MNLNDFFRHKVCINLERRRDRWESVSARFARHDIRHVERFAAFDWKALSVPPGWNDVPGAYGCLLSHLEVVREARRRRAPSVLIFEDDVVFADDLHEKFSHAARQLPPRWDMILFGGSHWQEPSKVSENVFRARATAATHAYALNQTLYDAFIELNGRAQSVVDVNNTALQRERECFCFMPHLAWQEAGYSDVGEREINVWWMKDSLVLGSARMEEVLTRTLVVLAHEGAADDPQATRRLNFILEHYRRLSPHVAVAVVERENVYDGAAGRARRFRAGFEKFGEGRNYFIFADSNVWISAGDIKANLMKCLEHDVVSSYREVFDLTDEETERLMCGEEVNVAACPRREWRGPHGDSCFYTRRGVHAFALAGGESSRAADATPPIFESPNRAFRLHNR